METNQSNEMGAIEWVTEGDDYECSLSTETQKLAKEELREDKNTRDQALEQIRNWIKLNPRIQNCRLGEKFYFRVVFTQLVHTYVHVGIVTRETIALRCY